LKIEHISVKFEALTFRNCDLFLDLEQD
jgi:hypothetical protein